MTTNRVTDHLEPLAIATNVTQSSLCRLDEVLLTFGTLYRHFISLTHGDDATIRTAVISSLEKRWYASDQEIFIASVLLNPFYCAEPFSKTHYSFSKSSIQLLLSTLWRRFYKAEPPTNLWDSYMEYTEFRGPFEMLKEATTHMKMQMERKVSV
jgi:hypothetical protein